MGSFGAMIDQVERDSKFKIGDRVKTKDGLSRRGNFGTIVKITTTTSRALCFEIQMDSSESTQVWTMAGWFLYQNGVEHMVALL